MNSAPTIAPRSIAQWSLILNTKQQHVQATRIDTTPNAAMETAAALSGGHGHTYTRLTVCVYVCVCVCVQELRIIVGVGKRVEIYFH